MFYVYNEKIPNHSPKIFIYDYILIANLMH